MRGTLVLVVGPSGVGKDSLIGYCRTRLAPETAVRFPRRVITRSAADESEDHDLISEAAFRRQAKEGAFALHWRAHGLFYGVPQAIATDLTDGRHVVVNASRAIVGEARRNFAPTLVVSVEAVVDVRIERLHRRGREPVEEIRARLDRTSGLRVDGPDVVSLDNSGPLAEAGEMMLTLLRSLPRSR